MTYETFTLEDTIEVEAKARQLRAEATFNMIKFISASVRRLFSSSATPAHNAA